MANCVVTGGAGFIGSWLVENLLELGHSVWAIDAFTDFYPRALKESNARRLLASGGFRLIEADLCGDFALPEVPIEYVFHLAGQPGVRSSWGSAFRDHAGNNILATQRLLDSLAARSRDLRAFVFASSSSVYGNGTHGVSRESDAVNPLSPYAVSKMAAESLCHAYGQAFSLPVCILRLFTVYGPRQRPDMALATFLRAAREGRRVPIFGSLDQRRDYTYVGDTVQAMATAAFRGVSGTINVGGGRPVTMAECIEAIRHVTGLDFHYEMAPPRPGEAYSTCADPTEARKLLSFAPSRTFAEGVATQWRSMIA